MKHAKFVSFTLCGAQTVQKAVQCLPDFRCERYARTVDASLSGTSLKRFAQQAMVDCDLIVFVGAAGIAVRAVAPYLMGKAYDPAVIVIDEQGKFVIPLLSGHLGGANALAVRLAEGLGAVPVLTTATDGRQVFAVDTWAKAHDCAVVEPHYIKYVSGALLRGETVGVRSDFPVDGLLPAHIDLKRDAESGFVLSLRTFQTQTAARDKAHIITGENNRTHRKDSGISCGIVGLVIGHLCRHFPKGGFKIVLDSLAEAAQLVAAGIPAFGF